MEQELKNLKFFIRTFGCQMNESDSERIAGILAQKGALKVERPEESDLILVNTCAVRKKSEEKVYSYLGRLASLKQKQDIQIGVVGCMAQLHGMALLEKSSAIDFILGLDKYTQLPRFLLERAGDKLASTTRSTKWPTVPSQILRESEVSAYIPVMEGCNNFCAYCIVPFARGREKFRPLPSILKEVRELAREGYKEIQFLGQNVNSYLDPESGRDFSCLLEEASKVEGIDWLRFITSHPKNFTSQIAQVMAASKKICRQLHLPMQAGSDAVLRNMNRGYTQEEYLAKVAELRRHMPEISLSTDIIVGFPGEKEKDFGETLHVLQEVRFTNIFSFCYSPRPSTKAAELKDDVPGEEKKRRLIEVQKLQKNIQLDHHQRQVGKEMKVLCSGLSKKNPLLYSGRNEGNQVVNFLSKKDCRGEFVQVLITDYGPYSLHGKIAISSFL